MDWRDIIMETIIASLITGIFGVIAVLITNAYINKRGYDKIDSKIGSVDNTTLSGQHKDIKDAITEKTSSIYYKVEKISDITIKNEGLYQNLDSSQKKIRDNVNSLVRDWEKAISENKELNLQLKRARLDNQNTREKLNKLELDNKQVLEESSNLKEGNRRIKLELENLGIDLKDANLKIESLLSENKDLKEENIQKKSENEKLSENIVLYKQALEISDKSKYQEQDLDIELEDDEWENEP